jgi:hypothetical protein
MKLSRFAGASEMTRRRPDPAVPSEQELPHLPFDFAARVHAKVHAPAARARDFVFGA